MKFFLKIFFLLSSLLVTAQKQSPYILTNDDSQVVNCFTVLPDKCYTFNDILNNNKLQFLPSENLNVNVADVFWIKVYVYNPLPYTEKYFVEFLPMLDNTLFYYNENQKKWISYSNGLLVNKGERNIWLMPCFLRGKQTTTLYIKSNIKDFRGSKIDIPAALWLEKENYVIANEQFISLATLATLFVFLVFFLFNAYIFYIFKDKTYIYYFLIQLGGVLYILTDQLYFNILLPYRFCVTNATTSGFVMFHDINSLVGYVAIGLILYGYVNITRIYLTTKQLLPREDKLLIILFWIYVAITILENTLICLQIISLTDSDYVFSNLFAIFVIIHIVYIAVLSYRRKNKWARFYLMANSASILIFLVTNFYYLFIGVVRTTDHDIISKVAIIVQALFLGIALIQRVLMIREELKQKQNELQIMQNEYDTIAARNKFIALENKFIAKEVKLEKVENEILQLKLNANERELAANTLQNIQKNDLLKVLQKQVGQLSTQTNAQQKAVSDINATIKSNMILDADWEKFKLHFEQVHPNYFKELYEKNPTLTAYEIRLSVYLHLKLSTKEIAMLLKIDPASVRKAKMRLKKKMALHF